MHCPRRHRVHAPMYEEAELGIAEPLQTIHVICHNDGRTRTARYFMQGHAMHRSFDLRERSRRQGFPIRAVLWSRWRILRPKLVSCNSEEKQKR
jgi:hypothetical protein